MNKVDAVRLNRVDSVYDGDTFRATINGLPDWIGENAAMRIYGIDTPELGWRAKCDKERELADDARALVERMLTGAKQVRVDIYGRDKYGRILVEPFADDVSVRQTLIDSRLAVEYFGDTKNADWCADG